MTATGPMETSLEVAKNWRKRIMYVGQLIIAESERLLRMINCTYAVDEDTDESRVETIFRSQSCDDCI